MKNGNASSTMGGKATLASQVNYCKSDTGQLQSEQNALLVRTNGVSQRGDHREELIRFGTPITVIDPNYQVVLANRTQKLRIAGYWTLQFSCGSCNTSLSLAYERVNERAKWFGRQ
jgi:hypothetical protein